MADSNIRIKLDTVRKNNLKLIYAAQNDYGARYITAELLTDGKKNAVASSAAVSINAKRADGKKNAFSGVVNTDGTVTVPVTQWMLEHEGEVVCSISAVETGKRLTTTHFYLQAQESVWDGTSTPSADDPNKDVILEIIASENVRISNENARISAENVRKTAETARIDAENARIANEDIRISNEKERVSAEAVRKTEFSAWQGEIGKISAFDKRIENLEAAVTPGLVTPMVDDSMVYQKNVPTSALPNAMISEIGGMTYKVNGVLRDSKVTAVESMGANMIPFPYSETSKTTNGITFTVNADGSIIVNGTATADARIFLKAYSYTDNIKLIKGETYTLSGYPVAGIGLGIIQIQDISYAEEYINEGYAKTFTAQHESYYMFVKIFEGKTVSNLTIRPMLNKGTSAKPYSPYFKNTLEIPEAVQALEGYGQGISKEYHNKIVLDPASGVKKFVKNTKTVVFDGVNRKLSKSSGVADDNNYLYYSGLPEKADIGILPICDFLESANPLTRNSIGWYSDPAIVYAQLESVAKIVGNNESAINEWLVENPMTVCYALATPTETDLSDYFGDDNLIGVESGGTVTMMNEYEYDVPSVIEYTVKGSDAV